MAANLDRNTNILPENQDFYEEFFLDDGSDDEAFEGFVLDSDDQTENEGYVDPFSDWQVGDRVAPPLQFEPGPGQIGVRHCLLPNQTNTTPY